MRRFAFIVALSLALRVQAWGQCPPDTHLLTFHSPNPTAADRFGAAVAVDGATFVIGAPLADPGAVSDAGAVYVFNGFPAPGSLVSTLTSQPPTAGEHFGTAVAISATMVVVGIPSFNPGGMPNSGKALVFSASGALQATLLNPSPAAEANFGSAVSISGNLVVVGASGYNPGGAPGAGRAYSFNAVNGALIATMGNPTPATGDFFGSSVSNFGGHGIIGAPGDDPGGIPDAGSAYVFDASYGVLARTLNRPTPMDGDHFGSSVGIWGLFTTQAVVGAEYADAGFVDSGAAYVFETTFTGALVSTLANPAPASGSGFGASVAIAEQLVIVGAPFASPNGKYEGGAAYIFDAATGAVRSVLKRSSPVDSDELGYAVGITGGAAIAGLYGDDPQNITDAGGAFVFTCGPNAASEWEIYN